tara:strand:- start:386 stop:1213 length:828 start_codon:yes stop_codon:yes gene_type:complete
MSEELSIDFDDVDEPVEATEKAEKPKEAPAEAPVETAAEAPAEAPEGESKAEESADEFMPKTEAGDPVFDEAQQEVFNREMKRKAYDVKQSRLEAEELRRQIEQLNAAQAEPLPEVPDVPEYLDPEYEQKLQQRDEIIKQRTIYSHESDVSTFKAFQARSESYAERANSLGVDREKLKVSGQMLGNQQLDPVVLEHILDDPHGPYLTEYLADNPDKIAELRTMNGMQAGTFMASVIKPAAIAARPVLNKIPAPAKTPSGSGMPEGERGPAGATFE